MLFRHDNLPIKRHAGQCALLKENDVIGLQSKVIMFFEELSGRFLSVFTSHDVPVMREKRIYIRLHCTCTCTQALVI